MQNPTGASSRTINIAHIVTPSLLDQIFGLRFPWPKEAEPPTHEVLKQARGPADDDTRLFDLAWPTLRKLGTYAQQEQEQEEQDFAAQCISVLPEASHPKFFTRAVGFIMLVDQCPRMFHTNSTNVRWTNAVFDPLAQKIIWHLLAFSEENNILEYEPWRLLGYDFKHYLVITSLVLSAADHSESLEHHNILHQETRRRRAMIEERTGMKDPFLERVVQNQNDVLAFSRWMRAGLPPVKDVCEFIFLRLAIVEIHYPVLFRYKRYPWRNSCMGRLSTLEEIVFLEQSGHFGEPSVDVQKQISEDIRAARWTAFI